MSGVVWQLYYVSGVGVGVMLCEWGGLGGYTL